MATCQPPGPSPASEKLNSGHQPLPRSNCWPHICVFDHTQTEPAILLSASFDRTAAVIDVRASNTVATWAIPDDAEAAGASHRTPPPGQWCTCRHRPSLSCTGADLAIVSPRGSPRGFAGWNPSAPHTFCVATSDGQISCYDARAAGSGPLTSVKAHQRECTTMVFNPAVPNMIATGGPTPSHTQS